MKIPKEIKSAIERRYRAQEKANHLGYVIDTFLIENGIADELGTDYYSGGCIVYCEPFVARSTIEDAIKNHKEK